MGYLSDKAHSRIVSALEIQQDEQELVLASALQSLFVGAQNLFMSTAVFAIFVTVFGAEELPWVYVASGIIIPLLGGGFTKVESKYNSRQSYLWILLSLAVFVIGFRLILDVPSLHKFAAFALPLVYLTAFRFLSVVVWGTANQVFNVRQSKRLFGTFASVERVAQFICGLLAPILIGLMGTKNLLFISLGAIVCAYFNQKRILSLATIEEPAPTYKQSRQEAPLPMKDSRSRSYIFKLFLIQTLMTAMYFPLDNAFLLELRRTSVSQDEIASYFALTSGIIAIAVILINMLKNRRLMGDLGTLKPLIASPFFTAICVVLTCLIIVKFGDGPWLLTGLTIIMVTERTLTHTLFVSSYFSLFQPLPALVGRWSQNMAITVAGPIAGGLMGVILIFVNRQFPEPTLCFLLIAFAVALCTIAYGILTVQDYPEMLSDALGAHSIADLNIDLTTPESIALVKSIQ